MLAALQLLPLFGGHVQQGVVRLEGDELTHSSARALRGYFNQAIGFCPQDAELTLDPLRTVRDFLTEPLRSHTTLNRPEREQRVREALLELGGSDVVDRLDGPGHVLSTSMRQVLGLAVAGICRPRLWVLDDPTSSLDALSRQPLVDTLRGRQREEGTSIWFSTHDLGLVWELAEHVDVMYAGQIVESARTTDFFEDSSHPYSIGLLTSAAAVTSDRPSTARLPVIAREGSDDTPLGCRFRARCAYYEHAPAAQAERCRDEVPELREVRPQHLSRCHYAESVLA